VVKDRKKEMKVEGLIERTQGENNREVGKGTTERGTRYDGKGPNRNGKHKTQEERGNEK
jgi:hypothetical protein